MTIHTATAHFPGGKQTAALILAAAIAFGAASAFAQDGENGEQQQATAQAASGNSEDEEVLEENPGDEIICRTERVTGSLTRRTRICLTRDEWNGVHDRTRDEVNRMGRGASGSQCIPNDPMAGGRC